MIKMKDNTIIEKDYFTDLQKIKDTIRNNQNKAMVVANSAMIMTYYEIGTIINQRKIHCTSNSSLFIFGRTRKSAQK